VTSEPLCAGAQSKLKEIIQSDEEVGRVAKHVFPIMSRCVELFVTELAGQNDPYPHSLFLADSWALQVLPSRKPQQPKARLLT
jgi:hypothetical protein